jgi:hypothetical protein
MCLDTISPASAERPLKISGHDAFEGYRLSESAGTDSFSGIHARDRGKSHVFIDDTFFHVLCLSKEIPLSKSFRIKKRQC